MLNGGEGRERTNLFLLGFSNHVTCHTTNGLVDDFSHGSHDSFCLLPFESFSLKTLNKVVCIEMEIGVLGGRSKRACGY